MSRAVVSRVVVSTARTCALVGATAAIAAFSPGLANADVAVVTPAADYTCVPQTAQAYDLPGAADHQDELPAPRCPAGQVPQDHASGGPEVHGPGPGPGDRTPIGQVTASTRKTKLPGARAGIRSAPECKFGACYFYSGFGYNVTGGTQMGSSISIHNPYLAASDGHTLGQLWATDNFDTAETGWTRSVPGADSAGTTNFFVYSGLANYSNPVCYPGFGSNGSCGSWTQVSTSIAPGDSLSYAPGSHQTFQLIRSSRGWEVYYGFWDVGYFSNAWYGLSGDAFTTASTFEWGGEIAASSSSSSGSCSDMGDGLAASNTYAAYHNSLSLTDSSTSGAFYIGPSTGYSLAITGTSPVSFRYGGPGVC